MKCILCIFVGTPLNGCVQWALMHIWRDAVFFLSTLCAIYTQMPFVCWRNEMSTAQLLAMIINHRGWCRINNASKPNAAIKPFECDNFRHVFKNLSCMTVFLNFYYSYFFANIVGCNLFNYNIIYAFIEMLFYCRKIGCPTIHIIAFLYTSVRSYSQRHLV